MPLVLADQPEPMRKQLAMMALVGRLEGSDATIGELLLLWESLPAIFATMRAIEGRQGEGLKFAILTVEDCRLLVAALDNYAFNWGGDGSTYLKFRALADTLRGHLPAAAPEGKP